MVATKKPEPLHEIPILSTRFLGGNRHDTRRHHAILLGFCGRYLDLSISSKIKVIVCCGSDVSVGMIRN